MSHSNYTVNQLYPRSFALRFQLGTEPELVAKFLEKMNHVLEDFPGQGYIANRPEIEEERGTILEVYRLYSTTDFWNAYKRRGLSVSSRVENIVMQEVEGGLSRRTLSATA